MKKKIKSLKFFMLQFKARNLYRDFVKEIYKLQEHSVRMEYLSMVRNEFEQYRNIDDEERMDYLIADGRKQFKNVQHMIKMAL